MEGLYERILAFARERLKGERVSGLDHALRVWRWCENLGRGEEVDKDVLHAAALLHDVSIPVSGRQRHYEDSARIAEALLREIGYPEEKIGAVAHVIRAHSRFGGPDPESREAEVLYDADVLDFIGAIGLVRGVARGLDSGEYAGDVAEAPALFEGMKEMAGMRLYTARAREIAEGRLKVIDEFIERLREELIFAK
jgi:uncharacterized protein